MSNINKPQIEKNIDVKFNEKDSEEQKQNEEKIKFEENISLRQSKPTKSLINTKGGLGLPSILNSQKNTNRGLFEDDDGSETKIKDGENNDEFDDDDKIFKKKNVHNF